MSDDPRIRRAAEKLTKDLADQGQVLAAGWQVYRLLCLKVPFHEPADEAREAFEAGAEYVFTTMMNMLDPGDDATDADVNRMNLLHAEIEAISQRLRLKYGPLRGSA